MLKEGRNRFWIYIIECLSPYEVCLEVAGVMDHNQLLAHAPVTATRGADGVVVQEDDGEQSG